MKSDQRKTFNGLALAVVQSSSKAGSIRVTASSPALKSSSIQIITHKPGTTMATLESLKK
jgi:beta-galactosidase